VEVEPDGSLHLKFEAGAMCESAPVAWQEINGQRVPIQVAFRLIEAANEDPQVGFRVGAYDSRYPLTIDPTLRWNTFLGGGAGSTDMGAGIAVDASGNVYVIGTSGTSWGNPKNDYAGGADAFVAKLNSSGALLWNTFLGSADSDSGVRITVGAGSSPNVYLVGDSLATWGDPKNPHAGDWEAFAAKLDNNGTLVWNTFLGSSAWDYAGDITVDGSGNSYIVGTSYATWGSPLNPYAGGLNDAFVAKLDSGGLLVWNTFLGAWDEDLGNGIAIDGSENIYVAGSSRATWGSPVNEYAGSGDAFVARLSDDGALLWNTFLGSPEYESADDIALDGSGNIYVIGSSYVTWGDPVNPIAPGGKYDVFSAKLNSSGTLVWNTFMGSSGWDYDADIAVDGSGNVYLVGKSDATWGTTLSPHAGGWDAFAAQLNTNGVMMWNAFLGSSATDSGSGIAVDGSGNIYTVGTSNATWGYPVNHYAGGDDAFVVKGSGQGPYRLYLPLIMR
jgi:hypothetical protein